MSDQNFTNQIKIEKRKRNQAYHSLDYMLSRITYFDFFSSNAFEIAKYSKTFSQGLNKTMVTSDVFLFSFFYCDSNLIELFKRCGVYDKIFTYLNKKTKTTFKLVNSSINENLPYSIEVNTLFEKATENALLRFKTPIVTSEILFVTMMEAEQTQIGKLLKTKILTDVEWHVLRYQIVKKLHSSEAIIKSEITKNQQYFAYLLKAELPEKEFANLVETNSITSGVEVFRNGLISKTTKLNIFKLLTNEIMTSLRITNKRSYSF